MCLMWAVPVSCICYSRLSVSVVNVAHDPIMTSYPLYATFLLPVVLLTPVLPKISLQCSRIRHGESPESIEFKDMSYYTLHFEEGFEVVNLPADNRKQDYSLQD